MTDSTSHFTSDSIATTNLCVVDHPLVARHLSVLRNRDTESHVFRQTLADAATLLVYEALRDLNTVERPVETPLEQTTGIYLRDEIVLISILRAGLGMVDAALRLIPEARVGHLGIYRDESELSPVGYYENIPKWDGHAEVVVVDPMLATGGSAAHAVDRIRTYGSCSVRIVSVVVAPEGVRKLHEQHPEVNITCAGFDRELDSNGYIRPGLGDAGDRLFGTG